MVLIRFVSESLGYRVQWDKTSQVAYVQSKPLEDTAAVVKEATNPYVVKPGDTLSEIARDHAASIPAIKKNITCPATSS